jgi:6-phospho-beta-glucosidase
MGEVSWKVGQETMKITVLGAAGVRTPLIVEAMARRQDRIGLTELTLMDVDGERLELIARLTAPLEHDGGPHGVHFKLTRTTDARTALSGADYVITTFRVGNIESRVVDEQVPLRYGVLGQETTGPGGFAMAMRSIPILLDYVKLMGEVCPGAWLINFANPAGMMAEAATRIGGWRRTVGICDSPNAVAGVAAAVLGVPVNEVLLDYFGLNHLGWTRRVLHNQRDYLPELIGMIRRLGRMPGLPFDADFVAALGMIPNEYLYYYYYSRQAVQHILDSGGSRAQQIAELNASLFAELKRLAAADIRDGVANEAMLAAYEDYQHQRGGSYMARETGHAESETPLDPVMQRAIEAESGGEGYAGVALDLIEALRGAKPRQMILNVPNAGAVPGLPADAVVEVPAYVGPGIVRPLAVGETPLACLGLMQQVKAYEQLTIAAATEGSYTLAVQALTVHPLVHDYTIAKAIVADYLRLHGKLFPTLS